MSQYPTLTAFQVNGKYILKSGTDFRQFSVVTLTFIPDDGDDVKGGGETQFIWDLNQCSNKRAMAL